MIQNKNDGRRSEIRNLRISKINKLKEIGMVSYPDPATTKPSITLKEVIKNFNNIEKEKKELKIVGRILIKRGAGKISFAKITDGTAEFQVVLQADILDKEKMKIFEKLFDMGDFANFWGTLFVTQKGEKSLKVTKFKMAGKTLLPLPEKWHGLQDIEEKYRKRYLDLISDKKSFERFQLRAKMIKRFREILDSENMMEIETPILQKQASGANAATFNTYHNDYNMNMVLRIACEAEDKMVMAGGYPGVYQLSKDFRNEGSDPTHIQEFTQIEWYKAYEGLEYNINLMEKIIKEAVKIVGKEIIKVETSTGDIVEVDLGGKWPRKKFMDLIREYADIDPDIASREELEEKAITLGGNKEDLRKLSLGNLLDFIYKKTARKNIIKPTFVMNYPAEMKPLAIQNEDGTAEVAQLVIAGAEMTNQYAELVDPIKQRELLEKQAVAKENGDDEAMDMNEDFITAMEHGMPPMTGTGFGIDRLLAVLTEQSNIRDAIFFPIMKPEENKEKYSSTQVAVIVLNNSSKLKRWQELNAVSHLTAALGAREGKKMFYKDELVTKDNKKIKLNTTHAIMIKEADNDSELKKLLLVAQDNNLKISEFTRRMLETSDDKKLVSETLLRKYDEIEHLGVLIFGDKKIVDKITDKFSLSGDSYGKKSLEKDDSVSNIDDSVSNIKEELDLELGIALEKAEKLVDKYITDPVTKLHSKESGLIMKSLARYFGQDEEKWYIIGFLHDLDWDMVKNGNEKEHSLKTAEILRENGATEFLIETIKSHNYGYEPSIELRDKMRSTRIQYALAAAETLTGLIIASSKILPTKTVKDIKLKSLKKRFKEERFAANCNRAIISECEKIGFSVEEFLEIGLKSLQESADELGI